MSKKSISKLQNNRGKPGVRALTSGTPSKATSGVSSLEELKGFIRQQFLNERSAGLRDTYREYQDNILADYVYGLFHPDVVFKENLDIKSPSYLPIPTTTFKFREVNVITTNDSGNFVCYWQPNFLGSQSALKELFNVYNDAEQITYGNLFYNTDPGLKGNTKYGTGWGMLPFREVTQNFQKYRLTSACMKVMFTGKVLDQSGMIAACATYSDSPRVIAVDMSNIQRSSYAMTPTLSELFAGWGDFDTIRQGQWARTVSIVDQPDGLTCVYCPTDPLNQVFVDDGTTIDAKGSTADPIDTYVCEYYYPKNANISYVVCGYGLPSLSACITIETYYNYEIIVKQEQMPYFNPRVSHHYITKYGDVLNNLGKFISSTGLISPGKQHDNPSTWQKVRAAFSKAKDVFRDIYTVLGPLYKVLV